MSKNAAQIKQDKQSVRDIDPNVRQRLAANPQASVWVSASAGTGKTKVLTDRILRLLLPRPNGAPGTKAYKILGLTFTKAAASEMRLRLNKRLGHWAVMNDEDLYKDLEELFGHKPSAIQITEARKLFADVVDTPGGMKIMTIHAFCQSVLSRFPLEAGLPPYFKPLEEPEAERLLQQAQSETLRHAETQKNIQLHDAFKNLASTVNEDQFFDLLRDVTSEQRQMNDVLERFSNAEGLYHYLCEQFGITPNQTLDDLKNNYCEDTEFDVVGLKKACEILATEGSKTDQQQADLMGQWLSYDAEKRSDYFALYQSFFFTKAGDFKKNPITKTIAKNHPDLAEVIEQERLRLEYFDEKMRATQCAFFTRDLFTLAQAIIDRYQKKKHEAAALDFDDQIIMTANLLKKTMKGAAAWVMYKLDQGIDHILVDEAQDTNPDQWAIIEVLCEEFFAHAQNEEDERTIFVVGDEKQSIYSFQRASPEEFQRMREDFAQRIHDAHKTWEPVDLNISFRSTKTILEAVDAVFAHPDLRAGLSDQIIEHESFRRGQAGFVELWPPFENTQTEELDPWDPPITIQDAKSGETQLAEYIAEKIEGWLHNKEELPSRKRAIHPGDIMILVRTRSALVAQIIRSLKSKNIPVSGIDRMVLNEEIIAQDCLAAAEFCLLPEDDLTLACLLKSPFIDLSEDELFECAIDRPDSLWNAIKKNNKTISHYLQQLKKIAKNTTPHEFFSTLLNTPCPASEKSGFHAIKKRLGDDALDAIEEFLNSAMLFEQQNIATLQNFVQTQKSEKIEIKREQEEAAEAVRIMTVHGSKGLQAPIVILPDTMRHSLYPPNQISRRLIWPEKSGLDMPLFSPRKEFDTALFQKAEETLTSRMEEEYRRLLYVAMTRAEDRLYIGGYKGKRNPKSQSWYYYIEQGLKMIESAEISDDGTIRLSHTQIKDADRVQDKEDRAEEQITVPHWTYTPAPDEPDPPNPLMPSRLSEEESPIQNPLDIEEHNNFARGNLVHKLLEMLPALPQEKRLQAAQKIIDKTTFKNEAGLAQNIIDLMNDQNYAPLFGTGSRAEVPITALLDDGRILNGRIDRLLITKEEIWIIDFKTGQIPLKAEEIPVAYRQQLEAYEKTLRALYPDKTIHKALLWTDGPQLMIVT